MKAKEISGQAPGGKRLPLGEVLPLATPLVVQIFPIYACNFRCGYCLFSVDKSHRHFVSDRVQMDYELYRKAVNDMTHFPQKIKVLRFVGIGEPLLHPRIVDMIRYTVCHNVAKVVELLTNASLLTPSVSDALIEAGLSRLVISVQGTNAERYHTVCGVRIDFEQFVDQIRYFYENKKETHVYIKVVDCALDGDEDKALFYEVFGDFCDTIAVEYAVPIHHGVKYDRLLREKQRPVTQFGLPVQEVHICPQPFFTMQINPDGNIVPCYSFEYPQIMGNCTHQSVVAIWNGTTFQRFRRAMLDGIECAGQVCRRCNIIKYRLFPEDVLNDHAERLKPLYEEPV
ncbi:radical SAM protein [Desulfosoma sp.]